MKESAESNVIDLTLDSDEEVRVCKVEIRITSRNRLGTLSPKPSEPSRPLTCGSPHLGGRSVRSDDRRGRAKPVPSPAKPSLPAATCLSRGPTGDSVCFYCDTQTRSEYWMCRACVVGPRSKAAGIPSDLTFKYCHFGLSSSRTASVSWPGVHISKPPHITLVTWSVHSARLLSGHPINFETRQGTSTKHPTFYVAPTHRSRQSLFSFDTG